jgi:hypothetical protein
LIKQATGVAVAAARGWVERVGGVRWRVGGVRSDLQILDGISKKTKKKTRCKKRTIPAIKRG